MQLLVDDPENAQGHKRTEREIERRVTSDRRSRLDVELDLSVAELRLKLALIALIASWVIFFIYR